MKAPMKRPDTIEVHGIQIPVDFDFLIEDPSAPNFAIRERIWRSLNRIVERLVVQMICTYDRCDKTVCRRSKRCRGFISGGDFDP
jgi:hypothetical protein